MYKSMQRLQRLSTAIILNRNLCSRINDKTNQHKSNIELKEKVTKSNQTAKLDSKIEIVDDIENNILIVNLNQSDLLSLFKKIIPHELDRLKSNHLELIFDKVNLYLKDEIKTSKSDFAQIQNSIKSQSSFKLLLDHTLKVKDGLNLKCLSSLFTMLHLINENPNGELSKTAFNLLKQYANDPEFSYELIDCLETTSAYSSLLNFKSRSEKYSNKNRYSFDFDIFLLRMIKVKTIETNFQFKDLVIVVKLLNILLSRKILDENVNFIMKLARFLLESDKNLDLAHASSLIANLKNVRRFPKKLNYEENLDIFKQLIFKCNSCIFAYLANPNEDKLNYYLNQLHFNQDPNFVFDNLYDEKILNLLSPFILSKMDTIENKRLIYNLVFNHFKCYIYDSNLMKLVYELVCENSAFRNDFNYFVTFYLLTDLRLPFVDSKRLASVLFDFESNTYSYKIIRQQANSIKLLSKLVLNDVIDEELLKKIISVALNLDDFTYSNLQSITKREFKLAKVCFSLFVNLDSKSNLNKALDQISKIIDSFDPHQFIDKKLNDINSRIQRNGFLSNGIYLDSFVIYDKSIKDIIQLTEYRNYFERIDQIPLDENQEM